MTTSVPQWGLFELSLRGESEGNPFAEVTFSAQFQQGEQRFTVSGFYDGDSTYRVRFMPPAQGEWQVQTSSSLPALNGVQSAFTCVAPEPHNRGVVRVHNQFHFAYDDGSSYSPFGTTCYAWIYQSEAQQDLTIQSLQEANFNKIRMCVFPKHYPYNAAEPTIYPYEKNADGSSDTTRFNPKFFQHFEKRVAELGRLGIEADIILWHPYDRWGYSLMDEESDYRYLRYVITRLSAYHNVWWSLANEYDFMLKDKPMERWDRFFEILMAEDPHQHLRGIHNGDPRMNYDHTRPAVTHACIQNWDTKRTREWRDAYQKPIINDELEYEGNIPLTWGNISAQEEVHRFWITVCNGGYAGHGETYEHPEDLLWWSHGGVLHGESWKRIRFLRSIVDEAPQGGLEPLPDAGVWHRVSGAQNGDYRLIYLGEHQPKSWWWGLPEGTDYAVDLIDTWNMTITPGQLRPTHRLNATEKYNVPPYEVVLPGKPYLAIRLRPNS
ncbi:MAG: DUF5060 domain-containing protein [Chloroflexi bacterium]|nr:DUF5060 domain-containing protein [Chloroflexota bacterium]